MKRGRASNARSRGFLLAVDVGNTNVRFGLFEGDRLVTQYNFATQTGTTGDSWAARLLPLLAHDRTPPSRLRGMALASVVPPLTPSFYDLGRRWLRTPVQELDPANPNLRSNVPLAIDKPSELGADRWANAIAARAFYGAPVVVLDLGTATTFDVVSARSEYLGGVITAGVGILIDSLASRTSRLPRIRFEIPDRVIGANTLACMQSGVYHTVRGQVREVLDGIWRELGRKCPVIATGGMAELLAPRLPGIRAVRPDLTLQGLRWFWERNR